MPLLFAAIAALQMKIDAGTRAYMEENEELLLRSGSAVRKMSLGYDSLLADLYWTRAVQYYGSRAGIARCEIRPACGRCSISPRRSIQNSSSRIASAPFFFRSRRRRVRDAPIWPIELVKRGIAENPDDWNLNGDLGFLYYWRMRDYPNSAAAYLQGSKNPNAPSWLKIMAARVAEKGGSLDTSRMIWSEIYQSTQDKKVRDRAMEMLRGLKAREDETAAR